MQSKKSVSRVGTHHHCQQTDAVSTVICDYCEKVLEKRGDSKGMPRPGTATGKREK
jgi:hypothetical protein